MVESSLGESELGDVAGEDSVTGLSVGDSASDDEDSVDWLATFGGETELAEFLNGTLKPPKTPVLPISKGFSSPLDILSLGTNTGSLVSLQFPELNALP